MKQILQNLKTGVTQLLEIPSPNVKAGHVLIHNYASLISSGTERMVIEFAQASLLNKARSKPELVRQVLQKALRDGIVTTLEAVRNRLDQPLPLGYSAAGVVIGLGAGVTHFRLGDKVASAGGGYAVHAEIVLVPRNLVVKFPEQEDSMNPPINFEEASFVAVGGIALHGLHLAKVELGQTVAICGLGLVGLLTVQLAKAAGCQVLGMDPNPSRCQLAQQLGCDAIATTTEKMLLLVQTRTLGRGVDAALITASSSTNETVVLAGEIARDRGRVVIVGAVGMEIPRKLYYEKELSVYVSRSYGPGRYDPEFEEKGHDYPIGYVRWTESRNMESFLQLAAQRKIHINPLITHRFMIEEAPKAYDLISGKSKEPSLGIVITYPDTPSLLQRVPLIIETAIPKKSSEGTVKIGLLGAGNYATSTLLPAMKKNKHTRYIGVCSGTGVSARHTGDKFGFNFCTTDEKEILVHCDINTVVIATPHHLHAPQVLSALGANKHVYCEKPLCLNEEELHQVLKKASLSSCILMVGFNRRYAPMVKQLKSALSTLDQPLVMQYRVNAGQLSPNHWLQDPQRGGGRIIGEVCHFVDLLSFLIEAHPVKVSCRGLANQGVYRDDNIVASLEFSNGSVGTITYVANGDRAFSKERLEIFGGGMSAVLDDFRLLEIVHHGRKKVFRSRLRQDKGHRSAWETFVEQARQGGRSPLSLVDIATTTLTTFRILESLHQTKELAIHADDFIASATPSNI